MKQSIIKLYQERRELTILEWVYLLIAFISVFVAGVLALFNQAVGVAILIVPLVAIVAFTMNVVSWAIVKLIIEGTIPELKSIEDKESEVKPSKSEKPVKSVAKK